MLSRCSKLLRSCSCDSPAPACSPWAQLVTIVQQTGASIVLSSSWREFPLMVKHLSDTMVAHGIPPPIDRTPSLLIGNRAKEIGAWLLENARWLSPELRWIAIDDRGLPGLGRHFVHTRSWGLTERDVSRAVALLGTSNSMASTASTASHASFSVHHDRSYHAAAEDTGAERSATLADGAPAAASSPESALCGTVEFSRERSQAASLDEPAGEGSQNEEPMMLSGLERATDAMDLPFRLPGCCDCTFCCDYARCSASCRKPKSPLHRLARKYSLI